jgi:type II secretory pathway pseudopilin PulG
MPKKAVETEPLCAEKKMRRVCKKVRFRRAVTIMELVIAVAMVVIIFAVVVPQFVVIRNSWDVKQGTAEALQNGRVLMDHINRNLSKAVRTTAVSESTDTDGYIEFEDNDGNIMRYDVAANNYVEYGVVGNLADLAGPVSSLTFTCYDACDINNPLSPVTDTNDIRVVKVDATFTKSASLGQDKTFSTRVYLRVNYEGQACWENQDVGDVGAAGNASCASYVWTIEGSGYDLGPMVSSDEFHFVYQSLSGDGQIIARVVSIEDTADFAKVGVAIRETLNGDSRYAGIFVTPDNGVFFQSRSVTGGSTTFNWPGYSEQAPCWLKVVRSGNTFSGYVSTDGSTWTQVGSSVTIALATDTYIGMAVCSANDGVLCTAVIDNVTFATTTYETFNDTKVGSDTTSVTISTPATNEGDLLIAAVATDGSTAISPQIPGNWTQINQGSDLSNQVTLGAWQRIASASEPATHQFTWSGAQQAYGWIMRFTGHDASNPINTSQSGESSGTATPTSPAVNTTVGNCLILRLGAFDDDDITIGDPGLHSPIDHTAITMDESASASGQVTYQGFAENNLSFNGTTLNISKPSGTSQGDLLIAALSTDGRTSPSPPSGWTAINVDDYGNQVTLGVWYKIAGSSEPVDYTFSWSGSRQAYGWIMRFTGHNPVSPINASADIGGQATYAGWWTYEATSPAVTTTVANCLITRIGGFDDDDITTDDTGLDSGHTDITMDESSPGGWGGGSCSGGAGYKQQAAIGSSGTVTFDLSDSEQYRAVTIAIAPSVGGGTVSGGAGYVGQGAAGDSGTSSFTLGSSNEARMLTIAIAPADNENQDCCPEVRP